MTYRRLACLAEIDEVAAEWRALERACGDRLTYFQSFDWCRSWVAVFSERRDAPVFRIETLWQEGRLVAVWPLMVQIVGGIRVLRCLGAPHSQYCNVVCEDEQLTGAATSRLLERIKADPGCDVAVFPAVPERSSLALLLHAHAPMRGVENRASVLDLSAYPGSAAYQASAGKIQRRNRNRRRNHLARLGDLRFEMVWPQDQRFPDLVRQAMAMKRRWLAETGRVSAGFSHEGYEDFLQSLPGNAEALSGACLSVLWVGERIAALELGLLKDRHYYSYLGSFDWDLRDLSPGKVQMAMSVCWLIDNGALAYDLLGMPSDYKQSWSNHTIGLKAYGLPFSWKGRLYAAAWLPVIRPAMKRVFQSLPDAVRRMMSGAQAFGFLVLCA